MVYGCSNTPYGVTTGMARKMQGKFGKLKDDTIEDVFLSLTFPKT